MEMLSIDSKSRPAGRVTVAQHGSSTGMSFRFSQLNSAGPVLGKFAMGAEVPSGTADIDIPAKISLHGRCFRICSLQHRWEGRNCQSSLKGLAVLSWHLPSTDSAPSHNVVLDNFRCAESVLGYCHTSRAAGLLSTDVWLQNVEAPDRGTKVPGLRRKLFRLKRKKYRRKRFVPDLSHLNSVFKNSGL